jgi:RimJ/RimL family protein N-acetyltransferase
MPKQHKYDDGPVKPRLLTRAHYRTMLRRRKKRAERDIAYVLGVFERSSGKMVGWVDFFTFSRDWNQWANLGYYLHNNYQGRGYGTEMVRAGVKIGFHILRYKRLEASINLDNRRSIGLVKKLGFRREGIRREFLYEGGQWLDHVIYAALNPRKKKRSYPVW